MIFNRFGYFANLFLLCMYKIDLETFGFGHSKRTQFITRSDSLFFVSGIDYDF